MRIQDDLGRRWGLFRASAWATPRLVGMSACCQDLSSGQGSTPSPSVGWVAGPPDGTRPRACTSGSPDPRPERPPPRDRTAPMAILVAHPPRAALVVGRELKGPLVAGWGIRTAGRDRNRLVPTPCGRIESHHRRSDWQSCQLPRPVHGVENPSRNHDNDRLAPDPGARQVRYSESLARPTPPTAVCASSFTRSRNTSGRA